MPLIEGQGGFPVNRAIGMEIAGCKYRGVRQGAYVYIEHSARVRGVCTRTDTELYDLDKDPWQLNNLYPAPAQSATGAVIRRMHALTVRIEDCQGIAGRDPATIGGHSCQ